MSEKEEMKMESKGHSEENRRDIQREKRRKRNPGKGGRGN